MRNSKYASYNQYTWKFFNSVHININIFLTWKFSHNFYFKTEWTKKNSFHFQANPDWKKNLNIFSIVASVGNLMFLNYLYIHFPKTKRNDLGAKSTTLQILLTFPHTTFCFHLLCMWDHGPNAVVIIITTRRDGQQPRWLPSVRRDVITELMWDKCWTGALKRTSWKEQNYLMYKGK